MINYFLKFYIRKRANELNLPFPNNWRDILNDYTMIQRKVKKYILFTDYGYTSKTLNGGSMIPHTINLTKEWAAQIILYNNENVKNAFFITIGHELTHKEKEISRLKYFGINKYFVSQTNEVHADFGATQKMFNSDRNILLESIKYKKAFKENNILYIEDNLHPSWEKRLYYAENYNFNEKLIRKIAEDVGCKNEKLIKEISEFYDEIILK